MIHAIQKIYHLTLISRGCSEPSMKRGGCKFGYGKTRGCPLSKKGGCSFAVVTQAQRVSPPPPGLGPTHVAGGPSTRWVLMLKFTLATQPFIKIDTRHTAYDMKIGDSGCEIGIFFSLARGAVGLNNVMKISMALVNFSLAPLMFHWPRAPGQLLR